MLISLLVAVLIFGVVLWLIGTLPIDPRFKTAAYVIVAVIAIIYLLQFLPGHVALDVD